MIASPCFSADIIEKEVGEVKKDYWVYVRLEDRSGITPEDDKGRSKRGDVVQILPCDKYSAETRHKTEWMIYKTALTLAEKDKLLEGWEDETVVDGRIVRTKKAYRKNKLSLESLGVTIKRGLVPTIIHDKTSTTPKTVDDLSMYETKRKFYVYVQRPLMKLANKVVPKAFAAVNVSLINTGEAEDSTHYDTLTGWEDAKEGDLVGDTRQETAECYDDEGVLNDKVDIDGSTTSADYYMKITVPEGERHNGTIDGGGFEITNGGTYNTNAINVGDEFAVVEWVIAKGNNYSAGIGMWMGSASNASTVQHCIISSVESLGSRGHVNWYNNIVTTTGSQCFDLNYPDTSAVMNYYNNTCVTKTSGVRGIYIQAPRGTKNIVNNIMMTVDSDAYANMGWAQTFTNNGASDTTGNVNSLSTDIFDDYTNNDFHLDSSNASSLVDAGTSLSSYFTEDIDGVTRTGSWDIGADELAASGHRIPTMMEFR